MGNVIVIRRKRKGWFLKSLFRRRVHTAVHTLPWCIGCDAGTHHPGKPRQGCHCPCSSRR